MSRPCYRLPLILATSIAALLLVLPAAHTAWSKAEISTESEDGKEIESEQRKEIEAVRERRRTASRRFVVFSHVYTDVTQHAPLARAHLVPPRHPATFSVRRLI